MVEMPKKGEYVRFTNYVRKIKPSFMIYTDFESILEPKNNGKQNPDDFYTNKYQNMLLAVMVVNQCDLIINLVSLLNHISVKMLFTI